MENQALFSSLAQVIPILLLAGIVELRALDTTDFKIRTTSSRALVDSNLAAGWPRRTALAKLHALRWGAPIVMIGFPLLAVLGEIVAVTSLKSDGNPPGDVAQTIGLLGFGAALAFVALPLLQLSTKALDAMVADTRATEQSIKGLTEGATPTRPGGARPTDEASTSVSEADAGR